MNCLLFLKQHISLFLASFFAIIFWSVLVVEKKFNFQNGIGAFILSAALFVSFFFSWKIIKKYSEENKVAYILYSTILIFNCCWLIACFRVSSIAWDTWNMYDMSRYVFSDFGYMDNIRQHIINTHYEMAFPPLFPILMAVVNFIFDCGASAATFVCGIFSIWIVSLSALVGKKVGGILPFALCAFVFLCGSCYCWLVKTGISQVLNFAFLFLIVNLLLNFKLNIKNVVSLAFFSSLGLMCRFDFLAVVVVCFTFVTINALREKKRKETLKYSFLFASTTLLFCSPWIIYSIKHFNKFFITDNGRRLINVVDTRPSTFFPENDPAQTLFDNFYLWIQCFFERMFTSFFALVKCLIYNSLFAELIVVSVLFWIILKLIYKKNQIIQKNWAVDFRKNFILILFGGMEVLYILTGYDDIRYHLPIVFVINYICLSFFCIPLFDLLINNQRLFANTCNIKAIILVVFVLFASLKCAFFGNVGTFIRTVADDGIHYANEMTLTEKEINFKNFITKNVKTICFYRAERTIAFLKLSTLSHLSYIITPSNITYDNVGEFAKTFNLNYLYSSNNEVTNMFKSKMSVTETEIPFLYKIDLKNE